VNKAKYNVHIVSHFILLVISIFFLGAGIVWQRRIQRAILYPSIMLLTSVVFIMQRWFSTTSGLMVFVGLLLLTYLIYWYDWLVASKHITQPKQHSIYLIFWLLINSVVITSFLYHSSTLSGYRIYHIPSKSMMPTLYPGDYVLVDLWQYQDNLGLKNEVVIFKRPFQNRTYIKRINYVAGDKFLGEKLPFKHYAVIGDNIDYSEDSRVFGSIPHKNLLGKACYIVFSLDYENNLVKARFLQSTDENLMISSTP